MSQLQPSQMATLPSSPAEVPAGAEKSYSFTRDIARQFFRNRLALTGLILLLLLVLSAVLAHRIAPYDPNAVDLYSILQGPSAQHWLGTDENGRDVFSRLLYAGRISLSVGASAALVAVVVGSLLGSLSGYFGGWVDTVIMRFTDMMLSIPTFFLLLIVAAVFRPSATNITIIIGLTAWMGTARLVRGEFMRLREIEFVEAAHAIGASDTRIITRHVLTNAVAPIIVAGTLIVGGAILTESGLSFLGLGVQPPVSTWGNMLSKSQAYIWTQPMLTLYPGAMIFLTVLSINFVGDGLRDALDPRMKNL